MRHLVLAAREDQVTAANATGCSAGSSPRGRTARPRSEADAILRERAIPVLPDILTNAGGVTVSYFEWVQDLGRLFWGRDEIRAKLAEKMNDAFDRVWEISSERASPYAPLRSSTGSATSAPPSRPRALPVSRGRVRDAMIADPGRCPGRLRRRRPATC